MIPQSRLQFTAPTALRSRKAPSAKLAPLCLSGAMVMRLAAQGAYPTETPLTDKQIRNRSLGKAKGDRAQYLRDYAKRQRQEAKEMKGK